MLMYNKRVLMYLCYYVHNVTSKNGGKWSEGGREGGREGVSQWASEWVSEWVREGGSGRERRREGERERERGNQMFAVFCTLTDENHTYTWSLHDHSQQKYWHQGKLALQCKMGESNFSSYSKLSNYSSLVIGRVNPASVSGKHLQHLQ